SFPAQVRVTRAARSVYIEWSDHKPIQIECFLEKIMRHVCWTLVFVIAVAVYGQDTRHVTKPSIPPSCVVVKAELPGLKKEDIEITATEDSISLRGEFKREEEVKKEGFYRRERREGKFYRTIPMPAPIKPDQVKASFKDGILEITAPEVEEAKPKERKVPIEA
ncbi:MAG: Hsp20/alpha crystallin family protein, partial [Armatimonadetes bacterium]|nr:Hsp20/alpha crystallin family protein [Armatimonadota bacterium]